MRTRQIREWTYEDVRLALEKVYGPVEGVNLSQRTGYILEECEKDSQPTSAQPEPIPHALAGYSNQSAPHIGLPPIT